MCSPTSASTEVMKPSEVVANAAALSDSARAEITPALETKESSPEQPLCSGQR